jgi:hypothetical protein
VAVDAGVDGHTVPVGAGVDSATSVAVGVEVVGASVTAAAGATVAVAVGLAVGVWVRIGVDVAGLPVGLGVGGLVVGLGRLAVGLGVVDGTVGVRAASVSVGVGVGGVPVGLGEGLGFGVAVAVPAETGVGVGVAVGPEGDATSETVPHVPPLYCAMTVRGAAQIKEPCWNSSTVPTPSASGLSGLPRAARAVGLSARNFAKIRGAFAAGTRPCTPGEPALAISPSG